MCIVFLCSNADGQGLHEEGVKKNFGFGAFGGLVDGGSGFS